MAIHWTIRTTHSALQYLASHTNFPERLHLLFRTEDRNQEPENTYNLQQSETLVSSDESSTHPASFVVRNQTGHQGYHFPHSSRIHNVGLEHRKLKISVTSYEARNQRIGIQKVQKGTISLVARKVSRSDIMTEWATVHQPTRSVRECCFGIWDSSRTMLDFSEGIRDGDLQVAFQCQLNSLGDCRKHQCK